MRNLTLNIFEGIIIIITNPHYYQQGIVRGLRTFGRISDRNTAYRHRSELADSLEEETENENGEERPERVSSGREGPGVDFLDRG